MANTVVCMEHDELRLEGCQRHWKSLSILVFHVQVLLNLKSQTIFRLCLERFHDLWMEVLHELIASHGSLEEAESKSLSVNLSFV